MEDEEEEAGDEVFGVGRESYPHQVAHAYGQADMRDLRRPNCDLAKVLLTHRDQESLEEDKRSSSPTTEEGEEDEGERRPMHPLVCNPAAPATHIWRT